MVSQNRQEVSHCVGCELESARGTGASPIHCTHREVIDRAWDVARIQGSELFIDRRDGGVGERDSHGSDLYPSKT